MNGWAPAVGTAVAVGGAVVFLLRLIIQSELSKFEIRLEDKFVMCDVCTKQHEDVMHRLEALERKLE